MVSGNSRLVLQALKAPFQESQKQLRQRASQASLQPSVPVWEQADLDSVPVPPHCNLPDVAVNFLKDKFLGKEVLRHESMQAGVQDASQQKQLKAWKTELLQVCTARKLCRSRVCVCLGPADLSLCQPLLQNAYEALSVELGYQNLVDSDEE